jgi:transcriptional regulator with XRE-family HTH domain
MTKTLRDRRLERGLTQQKLGELAHVSMSTVRELDRGHRPRSEAVRISVAAALGVTPDELWPPTRV